MKKLLLATSALVASAGFAAADGHIAMSGSASAGYLDSGTGGTTSENGFTTGVYNNASVTLSLSGASDNGLEFSSSVSLDAGDDSRDGFDWDGNTGGEGGGSVTISGGGISVTVNEGGIDDLVDDADGNEGDVQVSYSSGGISLDLVTDVDGSGAHDSSFSLGYAADGISIGIAGNSEDDSSMSASYDAGSFNVGVTVDSIAGVDTNTVEVGFSFDGGSAGIELADNGTVQTTTLTGAFMTGGIDIGVEFVSDDSPADDTWEVTGSMDAGGGLTIEAGVNSADAMFLGVAASF